MKFITRSNFTIISAMALALGWLTLLPRAQAVTPPPDGGYPGGNTAEGQQALFSVTSGTYNTAVGFFSLRNNTEGQFNTAIGAGALLSNTTGSEDAPDGVIIGSQNTAIGAGALLTNTTGMNNTANGAFALLSNTTGGLNAATGASALLHNTTGTRNTADGANALSTNTSGTQNTASGAFALFSTTEGSFNTASGDSALYSNIDGENNTAIGASALQNNNGDANTAIGAAALSNNTTGFSNTAIGRNALGSSTVGSGNIAIGVGSGSSITTGSGNIDISNGGMADDSGTIRIGDVQTSTFINGIRFTALSGTGVVVSDSGQLGVPASSARFKQEIKPMDHASQAILDLKPVTFRYKKEIDPTRTSQFGLVAEEVEKVNPDLVVRDKEGKPFTVRYDAVNAMLLNEFLKEHRKVENLEATVAQQQKGMEALTARLEEQAAQIQKMRAEVEMNKPAMKVALKNP
jgi:hypothetical protein